MAVKVTNGVAPVACRRCMLKSICRLSLAPQPPAASSALMMVGDADATG